MLEQPDRVEQFKADLAALKIADPAAAKDRLAVRVGLGSMIAGAVVGVYAYALSYGAEGSDAALQQNDAIVVALIGVIAAVGGGALYLKGALAGFLRFWLVRDLHERRAQTDRLLAGGDRGSEGEPT